MQWPFGHFCRLRGFFSARDVAWRLVFHVACNGSSPTRVSAEITALRNARDGAAQSKAAKCLDGCSFHYFGSLSCVWLSRIPLLSSPQAQP